MFYLKMHSTILFAVIWWHQTYICTRAQIAKEKEGNVLLNDALNTFSYGYVVLDIW